MWLCCPKSSSRGIILYSSKVPSQKVSWFALQPHHPQSKIMFFDFHHGSKSLHKRSEDLGGLPAASRDFPVPILRKCSDKMPEMGTDS